jgi:apolipoprotein D and lipocalin family protein
MKIFQSRLLIPGFIHDKAESKQIIGTAKRKNSNNENIEDTDGWLLVSFFKPFFNDYKIIFVDQTFKFMIVTSKNYDYFWILSKYKPEDIATYQLDELLKLSELFGFKISKMIFNQ